MTLCTEEHQIIELYNYGENKCPGSDHWENLARMISAKSFQADCGITL